MRVREAAVHWMECFREKVFSDELLGDGGVELANVYYFKGW